jgi:hypothetical protein
MLNSLQIEDALLERGFSIDIENAYAKGFGGLILEHPIFIKRRLGEDDVALPVAKAPVVVHPDWGTWAEAAARTHPGIQIEAEPYCNSNLKGFPKRVHGGAKPIAHGVAIGVDSESALEHLLRQLMTKGDASLEAFAHASVIPVDRFKQAWLSIEDRVTVAQRQMLLGHAQADDMTLSMAHIGACGGYDSFAAANLQYGRLGALMADELGVKELRQKTQMLAYASSEKDDEGQWQWVLRWPLARALFELGLLPGEGESPDEILTLAEQAALAEIEGEPGFDELPETTRMALVKARVGQGAYRDKMMSLWNGQCAVSGCDISEVLIASHAKSWKRSSNAERLDPHNGLLLSASIDRLFDQGLISFDDQGRILVKEQVSTRQLSLLGLSPLSRLCTVHGDLRPYLADHRRFHGFAGHV